jgi:hypothetical protein
MNLGSIGCFTPRRSQVRALYRPLALYLKSIVSKPITVLSLRENSRPFCFCIGYLSARPEYAKPRKKTQPRAAEAENVGVNES